MRHNIDKHVKPHIDNKPLNEYTAQDIVKALSKINSERMRQIVRQIYDQAFREAVRAGHIDRNPVDNVDGVRHRYKNGRTLERAEEVEFLRVSAGSPLKLLFRFYLLTGARPSEALRVAWKDISSATLRIRGTKTDVSDRSIPISTALKELLNEIPRTGDRLFPYTYGTVRYYFDRLRCKLSFDMTLKDLRHTFGTRCLEAGVSMKTVQKWMGHSNYETTANIYSHITTDFEREEAAKLDRRSDT
ncbi:MAG: tyrosine-type recombinase/integrase [Roseburia sp.]|nr:tyrosine-type recombinase/integrase [Roseburia sp.]